MKQMLDAMFKLMKRSSLRACHVILIRKTTFYIIFVDCFESEELCLECEKNRCLKQKIWLCNNNEREKSRILFFVDMILFGIIKLQSWNNNATARQHQQQKKAIQLMLKQLSWKLYTFSWRCCFARPVPVSSILCTNCKRLCICNVIYNSLV